MSSKLQDGMVDVISFSLDEEATIPVTEGLQFLSQDELERADRFKFGILRDRYVRGRAMMRKVLSSYLRCEPGDLSFGVGKHGKPFLLENTLHFNLSHSVDLAALAVSWLPAIGVDVERFDREVDFDRLAERCFRPREWDRFRDLDRQAKAEAFFWTWTAKEARMKATGEGFRLEPKKIEIEFEGALPRNCLEPFTPRAFLSPVRLPGEKAACTVAALAPFQVRHVQPLFG